MSLEAAGPLEPGPERWWRLLVGDANLTNLIRDSGGVHVHTPAQPGHTDPLGLVLFRNIFSQYKSFSCRISSLIESQH